MTARAYDRLMVLTSGLWLGFTFFALMLAIWEGITWGLFGQVVATASVTWLIVALVGGYLGSRKDRPAPPAPQARVFK